MAVKSRQVYRQAKKTKQNKNPVTTMPRDYPIMEATQRSRDSYNKTTQKALSADDKQGFLP